MLITKCNIYSQIMIWWKDSEQYKCCANKSNNPKQHILNVMILMNQYDTLQWSAENSVAISCNNIKPIFNTDALTSFIVPVQYWYWTDKIDKCLLSGKSKFSTGAAYWTSHKHVPIALSGINSYNNKGTVILLSAYIYIYIYMCVCVCVCVYSVDIELLKINGTE